MYEQITAVHYNKFKTVLFFSTAAQPDIQPGRKREPPASLSLIFPTISNPELGLECSNIKNEGFHFLITETIMGKSLCVSSLGFCLCLMFCNHCPITHCNTSSSLLQCQYRRTCSLIACPWCAPGCRNNN